MPVFDSLRPQSVWFYFDQISRIPRPSQYEEHILAYLAHFATTHNLPLHSDPTGNTVIRKSATPGREQTPTVILQSHVDMVCEKDNDVHFDFMKDPIEVRIDGEWVKATGTTLGADCGIGMAAQLALLAADDIPHGPLECLFTVCEEGGTMGASSLGPDLLTGKYLINLDSEDEGYLCIGSAGGMNTTAMMTFRTESIPSGLSFFRIDLKGLKGGHSGDNINQGRGNSNKLLAHFLRQLSEADMDFRLAHFNGGHLSNAIPREAYAIFGIAPHTFRQLTTCFEQFQKDIQQEYKITDPHIVLSMNKIDAPGKVIDISTHQRLLDALCGVPNGVLAMSVAIPGMVETSTNLASVKLEDDQRIIIVTSQRSSFESSCQVAATSVEAVFRLAGAHVTHSDAYPGWSPNFDSPLLRITQQAYKKLFGVDAVIQVVHAGLECGLFLRQHPELDMISLGPTLKEVHSPRERLEIASVGKFWKLLLEVISQVNR